MKGIKHMTGTPWHVEKFTRQEDDPKRHRSRCVHYESASKYCSYRCGQCVGSAHCSQYKEKDSIMKEQSTPVKERNSMHFVGIREIPMELIVIDFCIVKEPKKSKVDALIAYYKENGTLDKPIVVSVWKDKYLFEDKYLRYYVAKKLGLKTIPAKIGTFKESKTEDKLRKVGTIVKHPKFGTGTVVDSTQTHTTICFANDKKVMFDISVCVEKQFFTF